MTKEEIICVLIVIAVIILCEIIRIIYEVKIMKGELISIETLNEIETLKKQNKELRKIVGE